MKNIVINYFESLYKDNSDKIDAKFNGYLDYRLEIDRSIESLATNKASGVDNIPGEFYKHKEMEVDIKYRLQWHFKEFLLKGEVPNYFMNAKLVLISKDDTDHPQ